MSPKFTVPPFVRRGLISLFALLAAIGVGRLYTRVHQQEERIDQLEESLAALHSKVDRQDDYLAQMSAGNDEWKSHDTHRSYRSWQYNRDYRPSHPAPSNQAKDTISHDSSTTIAHAAPQPISEGREKSNKYTEPRRFNLNHIDSATLVRIPGIAARTASTILKYRAKYGGFYSPWQLQDFLTWEAAQAYMDEWCTQWFTAEVSDVKHIPLNKATVAELQRHPYITYEQALEIVRYRTRHKRIEKIEELQNFSTFTPEEIKRLAVYLNFE